MEYIEVFRLFSSTQTFNEGSLLDFISDMSKLFKGGRE